MGQEDICLPENSGGQEGVGDLEVVVEVGVRAVNQVDWR